jgi:hypothetical protein
MDELGREIKIFRTEEEQAQQYLFAYLSIRALLAERPDVVAMVNSAQFMMPRWQLADMLHDIKSRRGGSGDT